LTNAYASRRCDDVRYRALELTAFLGLPDPEMAFRKLLRGFTALHEATSVDFRRFMGDGVPNEVGLLNWYRHTDAYLWELTAYHCDPGFNYDGMCAGIVATLKEDRTHRTSDLRREWKGPYRVLCLGDGVGTLTIRLQEAGFDAEYHDLYGSRTSEFARSRFAMRFKDDIALMWGTHDFNVNERSFVSPGNFDLFDAVVSLDFLEHVPNVEEWARAAFAALKPGGLFCAVNRFECGSDGAIPMHLAVNDRYATEWEPLLARIGFEQVFADDGPAPDWHRKPL